ncbi:MAG: OsmC family protein [Betaproteobacteria bacterium]|nr:OsmC family protein [Betaproteobacteria bacterium]
MTQGEVRNYAVNARSTDTHGRVLCNVRNHHFVIDGPVQNGCPGEEVTPAELFLSGIAACGVELLQSFARADQVPLRGVSVEIDGTLDRGNPVRSDLSVLNSVHLRFNLRGVTEAQGAALIQRFKNR